MQFLSFVASTVDNTPSTCRSSFQKDNEFVHVHPPETFALSPRGSSSPIMKQSVPHFSSLSVAASNAACFSAPPGLIVGIRIAIFILLCL